MAKEYLVVFARRVIVHVPNDATQEDVVKKAMGLHNEPALPRWAWFDENDVDDVILIDDSVKDDLVDR